MRIVRVSAKSESFTFVKVRSRIISKLKGYEKSTKHRRAEALIEKGVDIQILSESDFADLVGLDQRGQTG